MPYPVANLTLAEALQISPVLEYARCIDASGRPEDHTGDWPEEGEVYAVRVVQNPHRGHTLVHVLGFAAAAPRFNSFEPHRFRLVCSAWLN